MNGQRVAVFGSGRSGVSAAKALIKRGAIPIVCDEASPDDPRIAAVAHKLSSIGAELKPGWTKPFSELGVEIVVTSPGVPRTHPALIQAFQDGLEVISEVELAYRISKAPIVAITGTNGKSTTTVMTWLALRGAGVNALLCGNIYGSGYEEFPLTEAAALASPETVLVAEISSFQLEWIRDFKPICAGITRIAPDHLDRYESFEDYAATKMRVFANQTAEDTAVIKRNDPVVKPPQRPKVLTFGPFGDAQITDDALVYQDLQVAWSDMKYVVEHNKLNAAAALLLGVGTLQHLGQSDMSGLVKGIERFHGLSHRMEWIGEKNGVVVINNSMCTNPEAVESSIRGLKRTQHVLMGGVNKDLGFNELASYLAKTDHSVYLYGQSASVLNSELNRVPSERRSTHATMQEAFESATRNVHPGEAIVLSPGCASFDQFKDFTDRGEIFRAMAKEWLK